MDDYYATLQVTATASPAVIRAAYRALTQRYHPDKNPDNPTAEAFLKRLNAAYAVLSDPATRRAYDAHRRVAPEPAAPGRQASAASTTPRPAPPEAALTGTVKGHTFTLRWYPARVIANTVWTETATTAGRDHVTTYSGSVALILNLLSIAVVLEEELLLVVVNKINATEPVFHLPLPSHESSSITWVALPFLRF